MATELGQAYVQIIPSARGISGSIQKQLDPEASAAGTSAGSKIGSNLKVAAIAAVAAAGVVIGKTVSSAISEGAKLEQSLGGIETLFKGSADKVKKYADEAYKTAGLSANDYMENVTSFSASLLQSLGGDTSKAADVANMAMIDMSDNANKMGTDMQDIQNAYQGFAKQNYTMLDNLKLGYGGTKSEMERLLADAQKLTGVKYDIDNLSDVYNAIHAVQEELDITGTTAKEAAETFSGSFAAMKSAFSNVLGNMAIGKDLGPSLKALAETTSTFLFDNFIPMVTNVLSALPGAIYTFIVALGPELKNGLSQVFDGLLTFLNSLGGNLGDVFKDGLNDGIYSAITFTLDAGLGLISGKIPEFLAKGVELVNNLVQGLLIQIPFFMNGVTEMLRLAIQFIGENLPLFIQAGGEIIMNLITGFIERLPYIAESVLRFVTTWLEGIQTYLPVILESGKTVLLNLIDGIIQNIPTLITTVVTFMSNFIDTVSSKLPEIIQSGVKILLELVKGIISRLPSLVEAAVTLIASFAGMLITKIPTILVAGVKIMVGLISSLIKMIPDVLSAGVRIIGGLVTGLINAIPNVMTTIIGMGKDLVSNVSGINLWSAGKAIIDGFVGGLKSAWEVGKNFVSGIAGWIKENKGPIEYDRKLLIPAGSAIMGGFDKSLQDNFKNVQKTVSGMGSSLSDLFDMKMLQDDTLSWNMGATVAHSLSSPMSGTFEGADSSNTTYIDNEGFMKGAVFNVRSDDDIELLAEKLKRYSESKNYNREPGYLR